MEQQKATDEKLRATLHEESTNLHVVNTEDPHSKQIE